MESQLHVLELCIVHDDNVEALLMEKDKKKGSGDGKGG